MRVLPLNDRLQPEVLGHKGPKASEIAVDSSLFEGMNFGTSFRLPDAVE